MPEEIQMSSLPWWRTDTYDIDTPLPAYLSESFAGPKGYALVRVWPDGRTDPGWGLMGANGGEGFMPRYKRGEFNDQRVLYGFDRGKWDFAIVMRAVQLVCLDIDGKNGGFEGAASLGLLAPTLSEVSKSGKGYHLFYEHAEEWDPLLGFGALGDRIGIAQGVDFRATGCVYHTPQQRWNNRSIAPMPAQLLDAIVHKAQKQAASTARILGVLQADDPLEVLMMQDQLVSELRKPIPSGKRNNTLFAIGAQMMQGQVNDWQNLVAERAIQVGLDQPEAEKLVKNIEQYGLSHQPPTP